MMQECDLIVADCNQLRGVLMDDGAAYELGYCNALGKPSYGYVDTLDSLSKNIVNYFVLEKNESDEYIDSHGYLVGDDFGTTINLMMQNGMTELNGSLVEGDFETCLQAIKDDLGSGKLKIQLREICYTNFNERSFFESSKINTADKVESPEFKYAVKLLEQFSMDYADKRDLLAVAVGLKKGSVISVEKKSPAARKIEEVMKYLSVVYWRDVDVEDKATRLYEDEGVILANTLDHHSYTIVGSQDDLVEIIKADRSDSESAFGIAMGYPESAVQAFAEAGERDDFTTQASPLLGMTEVF